MGLGDGDHGAEVFLMSDATAAAIAERLNGRLLACADPRTAGLRPGRWCRRPVVATVVSST
jgi:hypothetical protein